MKRAKLIIVMLLAITGFTAQAQTAKDNSFRNHSGIYAEVGLGVACGDIDTDLGLSLGVGYRYHFGKGIYWDMLRISYYCPTTTTYFSEGSSMRFLTGIRYNSMPLIAGKRLYGNFDLGYQLNVDDFDNWHGFAYEFGAGVILSRVASLGLVWEGNVAHYDFGFLSTNANFGIFGLKLGLQF